MSLTTMTPETLRILFNAEYGHPCAELTDEELSKLISDFAIYDSKILLREANLANGNKIAARA